MSSKSLGINVTFSPDMRDPAVQVLIDGAPYLLTPPAARSVAAALVQAADNAEAHGVGPCPVRFGERACHFDKAHDGSCKFTCAKQIDTGGVYHVSCVLDLGHEGECKSE